MKLKEWFNYRGHVCMVSGVAPLPGGGGGLLAIMLMPSVIVCIMVLEWFGTGFVSAVSISCCAERATPSQGCCSYVMLDSHKRESHHTLSLPSTVNTVLSRRLHALMSVLLHFAAAFLLAGV